MLRWPSSVENTFHRSRDVLSQNRCVELSSRILVSHIRTYHNGRELSGPAAGRLLLQPSQRHGRSPARPWLSDLSHSLNSSEGFRVQGRDRASIKPRHLGMCLCRLQWYWQEAPSSKRGGPDLSLSRRSLGASHLPAELLHALRGRRAPGLFGSLGASPRAS